MIVLTNGFVGTPLVANGDPAPFAEMNEIVTVADITIVSRRPVSCARSRRASASSRSPKAPTAQARSTCHAWGCGTWFMWRDRLCDSVCQKH